jgi:hypothetical protein
MTTRSARKARILAVIGGAALALIALGARPALASTVNGNVTAAGYHYNGETWGPQVAIEIGYIVTLYAQVGSPGCSIPANTVDTLKTYLSIAQSAVVAGKNVTIQTNWCGGYQYIYEIKLQP